MSVEAANHVHEGWNPSDYADVLERAARRVGQGWCQGVYRDDKGGVCLDGAVALECGRTIRNYSYLEPDGWRIVDGKNILTVEAARQKRALRYLLMDRHDVWNDDPARTQQEVVEALRSAAQRALSGLPVKEKSK